jgi:hypothetical protein
MANALQIVQQLFPNVTSVSDARRDVTVEVSRQDINSATVRNHKACALAVACKKKFKADGVIISVSRAYLVKDRKATRFFVPEHVAREIISFDRDGGFQAGEYALIAVPKVNRIGATKGHKPHKSPKYTETNKLSRRFKQHTGGIRAKLGTKAAV